MFRPFLNSARQQIPTK